MIELCLYPLESRSKYQKLHPRSCQLIEGHSGKHLEFPYLEELRSSYPSVVSKIIRDATMTTGAAWKSDDAGPNRILRWVMLLSDEELLGFGLNMSNLKPQVIAKLREKAATYEACMDVARKLAWLTFQMKDAPLPLESTSQYLEGFHGHMTPCSTVCLVCLENISFLDFLKAVRGKASIETGHSNPRFHDSKNVGFVHRECNIAQGSKTLAEFYAWIRTIVARVDGQL